MKKIRIIQVGVGHDHALMTYESLLAQPELFDVVGLVPYEDDCPLLSHDSYKGAAILSLEEALNTENLDAVAVETEERSATKIATLFAQKGIAVHLDKPGSQDERAFENMIAVFRRTGAALQMGYMYRFNPVVAKLIRECREGRYGQIYGVEAQMSVRHPDDKRQWLAGFKGGMTFFLGCHLIDLVLQLKGMPKKVIPLNACTGIGGCTAEDHGFAVLQYDDGPSFIKTCATEVNGFERRQLVICAEKATFEVKPLEAHIKDQPGSINYTRCRYTTDAMAKNPWYDYSAEEDSAPYDRYNAMMAEFHDIVTGEKQNPYSMEYELALFKTVLRACGM